MIADLPLLQPLPLATLLLAAAVVVPRLRVRWPLGVRVLARIAFFVVLTLLVQRIVGSPLQPRFGAADTGRRFWAQLVEAAWWWLLGHVAIGFVRLFVVLENRPRETRIVSDLFAGAVVVAILLAIVNFAFEVPIRGLLATSGVIAIVLGLALQSTLSDVFSGIAVGLERPYQPGDLLWVEGGIEGRVVQVNWRSTQIATGDGNIAVVPNSIIAKARLVNRSSPTPVRSSAVSIGLDAAANFERCRQTLLAAARTCQVMLTEPAASVACTELSGKGAVWEIGFSVADSDRLPAARTELLGQIQRHLRHAGIALALPDGAAAPVEAPTLSQLLEESDLFGVVPAAERELLIPYFARSRLEAGEILMRQGDAPHALFLLAWGSAEITQETPDGPRVLNRMSPGQALGAIGLITGLPYAATATALTELDAFRIGRDEIALAIKARPELAVALEELARRGQNALRDDATAAAQAEPAHPEMFLARLRHFLRVLGS